MKARWIYLGVLCILPARAAADVSLPAVFGDHMVLQRQLPVPVWGWALFGEQVVVRLASQEKHAVVDKSTGRWMVLLDPLEAGGPYELVVKGIGSPRRCSDVLVGDVWLATGQSNMAFPAKLAQGWKEAAKDSDLPQIRFFNVTRTLADAPQQNCHGEWVVCNQRSAAGFSAVAFFFGREIHQTVGVPIGLIDTSWGATAAQLWMSPRAIRELGPDDGYVARYRSNAAAAGLLEAVENDFEDQLRQRLRRLAGWSGNQKHTDKGRLDVPAEIGGWFPGYKNMPSGGYNAMIAPLVPYAIKGAIWYQGESNKNWPDQYAGVMQRLIADWRHSWVQGDFPFLFVQLASFKATQPEPTDTAWARVREAQMHTLKMPQTAMAVAIDVGDADNIHPTNKQAVGHRLALAARATVYGEQVEHSGPVFERMTIEPDGLRLRFSHATGGLRTSIGDKLGGFAIAGDDRRFVWADAHIEGDTVVVSGAQVTQPVSVRYAWSDNPACNLVNGEGLPASPFRTDNWPFVQEMRR